MMKITNWEAMRNKTYLVYMSCAQRSSLNGEFVRIIDTDPEIGILKVRACRYNNEILIGRLTNVLWINPSDLIEIE